MAVRPRTGFQPRNTPAERRAFFDLQRQLATIEGGDTTDLQTQIDILDARLDAVDTRLDAIEAALQPPPEQVGVATGAAANWGSGFTVARPAGITATDTVVLILFTETATDPAWTCTGFTQIGQDAEDFTVTVMVGTGFTGAGTFAPASGTVGSGVWTALTATAWANIAGTPTIGTFVSIANAVSPDPFDVPSVTSTTDNAILLAVGHSHFSTFTFAPDMTLLTTHDASQASRTLATAGASGPTTITQSGAWQSKVWVHLVLEAIVA